MLITLPAFAQTDVELTSPDGQIVFSFQLTEKAPVYSVLYKEETLIEDSELGLLFEEGGSLQANLNMMEPQLSEVDDTYELVVGKAKTVRDHHREVVIPLIEEGGAKRQVNIVVRAFNDGLAFRYEFPEQENWNSYALLDEKSSFNIAGNPTVRTLFWDNYTNNHEGFYHTLPFSDVKEDTLMDMPALFEFPGNNYIAITEANLRDYAGMYLVKRDGLLHSQLSPLPGQMDEKVKATLPHRTPWRVMLISDRIGALLESNILTSLNEPSKIEDLSWIKPGKTTFHWWNGDIVPDTTFAPGINFETNKYYIDFAARNNIEYHAVIGFGGFAWYKSDAAGYGVVGPNTDVTETVPSLDMYRVSNYAEEKGVKIHVWVHWEAIYPNLEEAFTQFEKWGIKGMMVDFMDRDDQEMVNIQEEILQMAAKHKLHIQFHGAFKGTGLHRTYPNEFTREGALNYENNKWREEGLSPNHDLDVVFTRLLAGATDYHLGGFRAVPEDEFKTQYTRPLMTGTRSHMLAMYVVLESYLASLCDYPEAYEGEQGFDFLQEVPTTWDETYVPSAEVGEYVSLARRKGDNWYVGILNNDVSRTFDLPLDFLKDKKYTAEIYGDAPDADENPNKLLKETKTVDKNDILIVDLASGGGQVIKLTLEK
ncbi:MAG: glycoside hydrolase family 97 protein [Balneolaceae bacterium]